MCSSTRSAVAAIVLLVACHRAGSAQQPVHSSPSVKTLVDRAAIANHVPPPEFRGYTAHVESELSLLLRDSLGRERATQIEQVATSMSWTPGGTYAMHVVGYRQQSLGSLFSTLSFVRGWIEPSLYGERLRLGVVMGDSAVRQRDSTRTDTIVVVHPFASDREQFYRFAGGDTITILRTGDRAITVVRLRVTPHLTGSTRLSAFDGEIDLDAERHQIVRMRGTFVVLGRSRARRPVLARMPGLIGVAYAEFVNTEVNGKYWLPAFQRTELQSTFALLGASRAVIRVMSTFSDYTIDDTSGAIAVTDVNRVARRLSWAPSDSIDRYRDWDASLGDVTASVHADDFSEFAPDRWRSSGPPRLDWGPTALGNVLRFDRVEGVFTGAEAKLQLRSLAPGVTLGAHGGWAWTERTVRGGAFANVRRDEWTFGLRAARQLATTNDFIRPSEPQSGGLLALFGSVDDFDYVDRRLAMASVTRVLGSVETAIATAQIGVVDDRNAHARLTRGLFGSGPFRANRAVAEGGYALASVDVELYPGMSGDFVQPGMGARVHYEAARGRLDWQRAEVSAAGRRYWGPLMVSLEGAVGAAFGSSIPPQALFELGGGGTLPGYEYKEFVGARAALFRILVGYTLPVWRAPIRVTRSVMIPGLAPGLAIGAQGGWTELGAEGFGVATDGVRATLGVGLTFFSGIVHVGVARPVDHHAPWKLAVGFGPSF